MSYPHHLHQQPHDRLAGLPSLIDITAVRRQNQQLVEVILLKSELLHDIEAVTHQIEKQRPPEAPSILPTGGADNYLLCRYIDTAVNQVVSRCQAYLLLPSPYAHRISTDHVSGWEEKSIYLALPHRWPPHCIEPLRDAIHNYIVERAVQLFTKLTDDKVSQICDQQAQSFYDDINVALNTRLGPTNVYPTFLG